MPQGFLLNFKYIYRYNTKFLIIGIKHASKFQILIDPDKRSQKWI